MDDVSTSFGRDFLNAIKNRQEVGQLFEFLPDVIYFIKNTHHQFVVVNQAFVEKCGFKHPNEVIGKTDLDIFPVEFAEGYHKDDRMVFDTGKRVVNKIEIVPDMDGSIHWHVTSKIPLHDRQDNIIGLAGITRDYKNSHPAIRNYTEMSDIIDYINHRFSEKIDISYLAELAELSVSQFERKFKKIFDMTPVKYIAKVRLNAACHDLIHSEFSIAEIAQRSGFYDHSYFTRSFINTLGCTPLQYRKQHRKKEKEDE